MLNEFWQILNGFSEDFLHFIPKFVFAALVFVAFWFVSNLVRNLLRKRNIFFKSADQLITNFIASLAKGIIVTIGFLTSMSILGLSGIANGILTGAGISAVIFGFAFKNIGENFISGMMLLLNRPFKKGDFVSVSNIEGTIVSMDLKTTDVATVDGKRIYIPNTMVVNNPLTNFTAEGMRRFEIEIELDVVNDVKTCKDLVRSAISQIPEILKDPEPLVVLSLLSANMKLKAFYWLVVGRPSRSFLEVNSEVLEKCKTAFQGAGIELADIQDIMIVNQKLNLDVSKNVP